MTVPNSVIHIIALLSVDQTGYLKISKPSLHLYKLVILIRVDITWRWFGLHITPPSHNPSWLDRKIKGNTDMDFHEIVKVNCCHFGWGIETFTGYNVCDSRVKETRHSIRYINTLRPTQCELHFTDVIFKCIFLNEKLCILKKNLLKCIPNVRIINIPALVQAWCRSGDKPLSEPMMVRPPTHICVNRPQLVNDILI